MGRIVRVWNTMDCELVSVSDQQIAIANSPCPAVTHTHSNRRETSLTTKKRHFFWSG